MQRSMWPRRWLVTICLCLLGAQYADAKPREVNIAPYPDQELIYKSGVGLVVDRARYLVFASVEGVDSKRAWIEFTIVNGTDQSVTVTEDDISVNWGSMLLHVLHSDEILKREKTRQAWDSVGTVLAAGANSYHASQAGSYTASGRYSGDVSGSFTVSGRDPVAEELARQKTDADNTRMLNALEASHRERSRDLNESLFRAETIEPGKSYMGRLQFELPKRNKKTQLISARIDIAGERHPFIVIVDGRLTPQITEHVASLKAHPAVVHPKLRKFELRPDENDDPELEKQVAVIDIEWEVSGFYGSSALQGTLHMRDPTGHGLDMPWSISPEDFDAGQFTEAGTRIALYAGDNASQWIKEQIANGTTVELSFDPD